MLRTRAASAPTYDTALAELLCTLRETLDHERWEAAAAELARRESAWRPRMARQARIRILATHTVDHVAALLPAAGAAVGLDLTVGLAPFGQLEQELMSDRAATVAERPTHVVLSPTTADVEALRSSGQPADEVVAETVARFLRLWSTAEAHGSRPVQHGFVVPWDDPLGDNALQAAESASAIVTRINTELLRAAEGQAIFVDCDRLAAVIGRRRWCDPRYWHAVRQAVSFEATPLLARATAAAIAADAGLSRRCIVVDLDDTLWGGILGEDGIGGLVVGTGPVGEAYRRFQDHLRALRNRGLLLAIASKNDPEHVAEALRTVRGMRLRAEDFVTVVADWRPKSQQILEIAERLSLGADALCFVDDNAAECFEVLRELPEVDVVRLPPNPSDYVAALADRPTLAAAPPTAEDARRNESYAGLRAAERSRDAAASLEAFLAELGMAAAVRPVVDDSLDRAAQLVQKTNQFNLTTRRRTRAELERIAASDRWIALTASLRDRFADHGIVGLVLVELDGEHATIDTLLLSCRVIGRELERRLLSLAAAAAAERGRTKLVGEFVATPRNALVRDLYATLGFDPIERQDGRARYAFELARAAELDTPHIEPEP